MVEPLRHAKGPRGADAGRAATLVSVVMPVYNGARYLAEAIESVLAQAYEPLDLIVVDDGSEDGSAEIARGYREGLRYVYQENAGTGAARNQGVRIATGSLYSFLDADDRFTPGRLGQQVDALRADPSLEAVFGHVSEFVSPELGEQYAARLRAPQSDAPARLPGTMLIRAEAFHRVGPWSESVRAEAVEWLGRAADRGLRSRMLSDVVLERRLHDANKGLQPDAQLEYFRTIRSILDRRRPAESGEGVR